MPPSRGMITFSGGSWGRVCLWVGGLVIDDEERCVSGKKVKVYKRDMRMDVRGVRECVLQWRGRDCALSTKGHKKGGKRRVCR